ncbi:MAG TPA: hypothetical protein VD794_01505 [Flavisolibacter sp.]|nr:hypothetical protein [Flavisolibacter sp.]
MLKRKCASRMVQLLFTTAGLLSVPQLFAQNNSPYSRYGLGDVVPSTNISNRAIGGIQAAFADPLTVNFSNPASYSSFIGRTVPSSRRLENGRVILDAGINLESQTLRSPDQTAKFTSTNALFSYLQVGVPLRRGWGLSFGLRPLTRVSYNVVESSQLTSEDSVITEHRGDGGSYLPSIGTGVAIKNLSLGVNVGYLFGKRETSRRRAIFNDEVAYNNANFTTLSNYGNLFFSGGAQYKIDLAKSATKTTVLRLGASGNIRQTLNGSQDITVETFVRDQQSGDFRQDSVSDLRDVDGKVEYPASYTLGFVVENNTNKGGNWLAGLDFVQTKWDDYRFFGEKNGVQNNWQIRAGGQIRPESARNYFSNVTYRAGFFTGMDYITAGGNDLPQWGVTAGLGLPITNFNRLSPGQFTMVNLALEYTKRGNDDNILKENLFRVSIGLNFSDIWFTKRKYD